MAEGEEKNRKKSTQTACQAGKMPLLDAWYVDKADIQCCCGC